MIRVLLYADVDLNLIDGSSIWLASLAELLADSGRIDVTVLRKTPCERDVVIRAAASRGHVTLVDPWREAATDKQIASTLAFNAGRRVHPAVAASLIRVLDNRRQFDLFVVRSLGTASILSGERRFSPRLWTYVTDPLRHRGESDVRQLRQLLHGSRRLVCQSEEARDCFLELTGCEEGERFVLLPPIVPACERREAVLDPLRPKLGYSGKFSSQYLITETLDAFARIRRERPEAEFHVVGDKFNNDPSRESFVDDVQTRLETDPGVTWHGAKTRAEAAEIVAGVDVTASWRDASFDSSVEISTKLLESAALGVPPLLNPTPIQRRIFGTDYAGYVDSADAFVARFLSLTATRDAYARASEQALRAAEPFLRERALERILPMLLEDTVPGDAGARRRLLVAGHDFKFASALVDRFRRDPRYSVNEDRYSGHAIRDTEQSEALLVRSDIVFCEWCLGNAEWYSHNKAHDQALVVRLHSQELRTSYLDRVDWDSVDAAVFICDHHRDAFLERFPFMRRRARLIYNSVDRAALARPKTPEARFTLGLLGMVPRLKSPHVAVELLARLRRIDSRYRLSIKGRRPEEYEWVWRRPGERSYYEEIYELLSSREFRRAVSFDDFGDDVADWLTGIGMILSTSEREGSHQAVAEGMASGSVPIIRDWPGADRLYPAKYVFHDLDAAVEGALALRDPRVRRRESQACMRFARDHFDESSVGDQWDELLSSLWTRLRVPQDEAA